jgi:hypothetical protein
MKTLIAATALALTAFSASAMVDTSAIEQYAPNADVTALTEAEQNLILSVIHSSDSEGEKRSLIWSLLN